MLSPQGPSLLDFMNKNANFLLKGVAQMAKHLFEALDCMFLPYTVAKRLVGPLQPPFRSCPCAVEVNSHGFTSASLSFYCAPSAPTRAFHRSLLDAIPVSVLHGDMHLIHTDLKPENILLTESGYTHEGRRRVPRNYAVRIIDFGGATDEDHSDTSIVSTRHYRAPEVIVGVCNFWDDFSCDTSPPFRCISRTCIFACLSAIALREGI